MNRNLEALIISHRRWTVVVALLLFAGGVAIAYLARSTLAAVPCILGVYLYISAAYAGDDGPDHGPDPGVHG